MQLVIVAAIAENGIIGDGKDLPWPSIPADKKQYRERVSDDPVVLGRRTFEEMIGDLPGSAQLVMTRDTTYEPPTPTATPVHGCEDAITHLRELNTSQAFVLGGEEIYRVFLPVADRMVLSRIHGSYEGSREFPAFSTTEWTMERSQDYERFTLQHWIRSSSDQATD